jgi:phosphate transport system protein
MREHYAVRLRELEDNLVRLSSLVEQAINGALEALQLQDDLRAEAVIQGDDLIDAIQYVIEESALALIATQQPLARDLRLISATLNIAGELERVGDYAEGIAKLVIREKTHAQPTLFSVLLHMARQAQIMLHRALDAYLRHDAQLAACLKEDDREVDRLAAQIQASIIALMVAQPLDIPALTQLLYISHNIERIADRAINIGERVIFMASGESLELPS